MRRLAYTYSLLLLVILLVGFGLYSYSAGKVREGIQRQTQLSLQKGAEDVTSAFQTINAIAAQISENTDFRSFALSAHPDNSNFYLRAQNVQRELVNFIPLERTLPVSSGFIYLKNTDYVISYAQFSQSYLYYKGTKSFRTDSYQEWLTWLSEPEGWYGMRPVSDFQPHSRDFLYAVPLSNGANIRMSLIPAVLCYQFDHTDLLSCFSDVELYDSGYIVAVSGDESVNFVLSEENMSAPGIGAEELHALSYHANISSYKDQATHATMTVTRAETPSGWIFYLVQPLNKTLYSMNTYQRLFSFILLIAIAAGALMVYLLSVFNAQPVIALSNDLMNERAVTADLNAMIHRNRPLVNETFVRRIMEGGVNVEGEMDYIKDALGLSEEGVKYCVLFIKAFPSSDTIIHSGDMDLCIQNYDVLVRDAIARYFPDTGYIYKPDDRNFAVLLATSDELSYEECVDEIRTVFARMHDELLSAFGIWVNAGIGGRNGLLQNTWKSYQQARDANSSATTERFICDSLSANISADVYYYPESYAVQLTGFISSGNRDQVNELFHMLSKENTENRHLSPYQMRWLINAVRTTLFQKRFHLPADAVDSPEKQHQLDLMDRQFEENLNLTSLRNIALTLCELCSTNADAGSNELIAKIQDYLNANYSDSSLCLTKISDEFNISENYFSYLFKKVTGENFSVYLEKLRMAKARELVCGSGQPLSAIYTLVGYNNSASFRRAFKKIFGVSPKEMRERAGK